MKNATDSPNGYIGVTRPAPLVIEEIASHRNGVSGEPFYAVRFVDPGEETRMVASVFERRGHVAVFALGGLAQGIIAFGKNSWRGDHYEPELRAAITAWEQADRPTFAAVVGA